MFDESFWVLTSFLIFIGFTFKPVKSAILNMLDERQAKVISDLKEASKINTEAQAMLTEIKKQYEEAQTTAKAMVEKANSEAKAILQEAKKEAIKITKKRIELVIQKISYQEEQLIREIKQEAINSAISSVNQMLLDDLDKETKLSLIDESINSLKKFVH
jgi:F-type H+-transporting ATPase subunit b